MATLFTTGQYRCKTWVPSGTLFLFPDHLTSRSGQYHDGVRAKPDFFTPRLPAIKASKPSNVGDTI